MRDYRGVSYDRIEDPKVREAVATVDEFLRQLSFGVANLNVGKRADGSGRPVTPSALDDYFYLPGRNGGQLGHGGNAASNSLTLASTRHATKGKVYLGTAQQSAYDELNNRLGSGTPSPETKLHVLGNPQPSLTTYTLNTNRSIGAEWYGIPSDPATYTYLIDANDATQIFHEDVAIQSSAAQFGVTPTVAAAASYTVSYNAYRTGGGGTGTYTFTIIDSSGVAYLSAALNLADLNTGSPLLQTPVVVSALGGSGTANSIKITITKTNTVGEQFRFSELSFTGAGAGAGSEPALTLFERTALTSLPYSIWRDESDVTVASVSSTGAGQFQNVLLEDPGAGTGAISLIAPSGVTSYSLTFPADDGDNLDLLQTNGSGTLSWVTFASLLDDDLEAIGALTRTRGDLIVGGASAWVDLAIGTAAQLLQVNTGATDPAWVSMSADATLAAGGALTLATVNATVGTFGSATQVAQVTVNAKGLVTTAANVSITYPGGMTDFAIPTVDVDVLAEDAGVATTALRSDARLQLSQAITPTWTGLHTYTRASDATAITINSFSNVGTSALLQALDTSAVRLFDVAPSGTVSISNTTSALTGSVKFQVRAPAGQSANIAQVLLNAATVWSVGSTGKMVCTTLAPQIDIASAAANLALTSTDTDGNTVWSQISLTAGVTGVLPIANGGTNKALTLINGGLVYTDADSMEIVAAPTATGQVLRATSTTTFAWGALNLSDTDAITGILPISNGGTGQITAVAGFNALATVTSTSFGRSFLDRADPAAGRTLLGLGALAMLSAVAETDITDGTLLARVAANETVTGTWRFNTPIGFAMASPASPVDFGTFGDSYSGQTILLRHNANSRIGLGVDNVGGTYGVKIFAPSDASHILDLGTMSAADGTTFTPLVTLLTGGNFGIGAATTNPLEKLAIGYGSNTTMAIGTATNNKLFIGTFNDGAALSINRNPATGVFSNAALYHVEVVTNSLLGYIAFATPATTNVEAVQRRVIGLQKTLSDNTTTGLFACTIANDTCIGGSGEYCVEVRTATNFQLEIGSFQFYASKTAAGAIANLQVFVTGVQSFTTSGTLGVVFTITGSGNLATLNINANSSLTPTFLKLTYELRNLTQQAVAYL